MPKEPEEPDGQEGGDSMRHRILLVDDEPMVTEALRRCLSDEPYEVLTACSAEEALELMRDTPVDLVLSDHKMPGMSGGEFLSVVKEKYPETVRILVTGYATLDMAIQAINQGQVYHFFSKPIKEIDVAVTIRHALQQRQLMIEARRLLQRVKAQSAILEELERESPGLTRVDRDHTGAIVIDESASDAQALILRMSEELRQPGYRLSQADSENGRAS